MADYCIFCLKIIPSDFPVTSNEAQRFLKLLSRYLGTNISRRTENPECQSQYKLCEDCIKIIDSFCDLYDKMKTLELKADWKIWKLKNIIVSANKVPSRLHAFRERYNEKSSEMEIIQDLRKGLIKRCSLKLSKNFPRVLLSKQRIKKVANCKNIAKSMKTNSLQDRVDIVIDAHLLLNECTTNKTIEVHTNINKNVNSCNSEDTAKLINLRNDEDLAEENKEKLEAKREEPSSEIDNDFHQIGQFDSEDTPSHIKSDQQSHNEKEVNGKRKRGRPTKRTPSTPNSFEDETKDTTTASTSANYNNSKTCPMKSNKVRSRKKKSKASDVVKETKRTNNGTKDCENDSDSKQDKNRRESVETFESNLHPSPILIMDELIRKGSRQRKKSASSESSFKMTDDSNDSFSSALSDVD